MLNASYSQSWSMVDALSFCLEALQKVLVRILIWIGLMPLFSVLMIGSCFV